MKVTKQTFFIFLLGLLLFLALCVFFVILIFSLAYRCLQVGGISEKRDFQSIRALQMLPHYHVFRWAKTLRNLGKFQQSLLKKVMKNIFKKWNINEQQKKKNLKRIKNVALDFYTVDISLSQVRISNLSYFISGAVFFRKVWEGIII